MILLLKGQCNFDSPLWNIYSVILRWNGAQLKLSLWSVMTPSHHYNKSNFGMKWVFIIVAVAVHPTLYSIVLLMDSCQCGPLTGDCCQVWQWLRIIILSIFYMHTFLFSSLHLVWRGCSYSQRWAVKQFARLPVKNTQACYIHAQHLVPSHARLCSLLVNPVEKILTDLYRCYGTHRVWVYYWPAMELKWLWGVKTPQLQSGNEGWLFSLAFDFISFKKKRKANHTCSWTRLSTFHLYLEITGQM